MPRCSPPPLLPCLLQAWALQLRLFAIAVARPTGAADQRWGMAHSQVLMQLGPGAQPGGFCGAYMGASLAVIATGILAQHTQRRQRLLRRYLSDIESAAASANCECRCCCYPAAAQGQAPNWGTLDACRTPRLLAWQPPDCFVSCHGASSLQGVSSSGHALHLLPVWLVLAGNPCSQGCFPYLSTNARDLPARLPACPPLLQATSQLPSHRSSMRRC